MGVDVEGKRWFYREESFKARRSDEMRDTRDLLAAVLKKALDDGLDQVEALKAINPNIEDEDG